jgi:hypothetical protein
MVRGESDRDASKTGLDAGSWMEPGGVADHPRAVKAWRSNSIFAAIDELFKLTHDDGPALQYWRPTGHCAGVTAISFGLAPLGSRLRRLQRAQVAQSVEQRNENPRVGGSIPPLGTTTFQRLSPDFGAFFMSRRLFAAAPLSL